MAEDTKTRHTPVLLTETLEALDLKNGEIFLDATFGGGGHSRGVRERWGEKVRIVGLDQDPRVLVTNPDFEIYRDNFRNLDKVLDGAGIGSVDAILFDLGISSDQLEGSGRGFSFLHNEPLDMRMNGIGPTAADILNSFSEEALELILRGFGEERYSARIASAIARRRDERALKTTFDLVEAVREGVPKSYERGRINPATRTFQAIRIAVNEELTSLEDGLEKGFKILAHHGRFVVISFHSLEDRLVKNFFRTKSAEGMGELMHKKPLVPTEIEITRNPRARSAKLRTLKKI